METDIPHYTTNNIDLCSVEYLGLKVNVNCDTEYILELYWKIPEI